MNGKQRHNDATCQKRQRKAGTAYDSWMRGASLRFCVLGNCMVPEDLTPLAAWLRCDGGACLLRFRHDSYISTRQTALEMNFSLPAVDKYHRIFCDLALRVLNPRSKHATQTHKNDHGNCGIAIKASLGSLSESDDSAKRPTSSSASERKFHQSRLHESTATTDKTSKDK